MKIIQHMAHIPHSLEPLPGTVSPQRMTQILHSLEPIGRVQYQSLSPYQRRPKAGISCGWIGISLYKCSMSVFANTAQAQYPFMREMALSTVSYEMVPTSVGICELTDGPPKGAERSWMTRNLPSVFFSLRPKGDI